MIIDFTLLDVEMELSILEDQVELIEEQIQRGRKTAKRELVARVGELSFDDEAEWARLHQEHDFQVDFIIPRILRCPPLVTLFAVYESAVKEIAGLVQKRQGRRISIDDLKGDLLTRAKKYYKHVLHFKLSRSDQHWQQITVLSDLRNVIAHTNGRLDVLSEERRAKILKIDGVEDKMGYLVVNGAFLRDTFALVREDLEDLVARYKELDKSDEA